MDKVLIVDDDAKVLKRLRKDLGKFVGQFEVLAAADAAAALKILDRERVSVLILDLETSCGNGSDLLAHMRQNRPQIPCIVMTDRSEEKDAVASNAPERQHIIGCIVKPYETKALFSLIMEGLERIDEGVFWREYRRH